MNSHLACYILLVNFVSGKSSQTSQNSNLGHLDSAVYNLQDTSQQLLVENTLMFERTKICREDTLMILL